MSGRISIDNLSDSLKEMIENSGMTEEQIIELLKSKGINELQTNSKNVIDAINELFQNANNGKELIASAIGEPLDSSDTFSAMSNDIHGLLGTFKTNMMKNGVAIESGDKFKQLIDKIATLSDNEGKGIQYASGQYTPSSTKYFEGFIGGNLNLYYVQINNLTFKPSIILLNYYDSSYGDFITFYSEEFASDRVILANPKRDNVTLGTIDNIIKSSSCTINSTGFVLPVSMARNYTWIAIGVGEEDTTLRDSLAGILGDKGIEVNPEDDMATLIGKTDVLEVTRFPAWYTADQKRLWFKLSNSLKGSEDQRAHLIGDEIYLLHGFGNTTSHESFSLKTGQWTTRADKYSVYDFSSITYNNKIYVSGGETSMNNYTSRIDCYDPVNNTFTNLANKYRDTYQDQMFVKDNILYIFNGWLEGGSRDTYYHTINLDTNEYAYKYKDSSVPSTNTSIYYNNYFYYVAAASGGATNLKSIYRATVSKNFIFSNIVEVMTISSSDVGDFFQDEKGNVYMYTYTSVFLLDFSNGTYSLVATYPNVREYGRPGVVIKDDWLYVMCGYIRSGEQFSQILHTYYLK